jgi:Domain of unknown function (DUF1707)
MTREGSMSTPATRHTGGYRVGDADRSRTVELLKEAHATGYLELDETDERLGLALAARTRDDLDRLVADLPPDWRARQGGARRGAEPVRRRPAGPPVWAVLVAVAAVALVVLAVATGRFFFPWPLLWLFFVFGHRRHAGRWSTRRL